MSKNMSTIPAVDEYEKRRARGIAAVEEAMAANNVVKENLNGLEDPYKDQFAVSLPKSNEIDYGNVNNLVDNYRRESMNNLFHEKKDAPVIHDDVPIIDTTVVNELPTEELVQFEQEKKEEEELKSDLAFMDEYWKNLYTDADREADEKRKKAAKWITAAQMLGDSIGALSNVYWTGKGANAMKFEPGAQKAAAATYQLEKDIREAREKAAKAQYDATLKKYQLEMDKAKADREKADADRKHEETVRHNKATEDISRLSAENAAKSANTAMYNAETSRMNAATASRNASVNEAEERRKAEQYNKQHGDRKFLIGDQWVNIPKDKWEGVVGSIYNRLPEEVRKVYETQVTDELGLKKETRKAPTIAVMDAAVRQYAQDPAVMEAILKAAGIKAEEADPKDNKREKENTSTDSSETPIQAYSAPADEWGSQWRRRAGLDTTDFSQFKRK